MSEILTLSVYLIAAHVIFDFPLQGDYLSKMKSHGSIASQRIHTLFHAFLHASAVLHLTAMPILFLAELLVHFTADRLKVMGRIPYWLDQAIHIICKILWAIIFLLGSQ